MRRQSMNILIAVDGSASSHDAVRLAASLVNPAADAVAIYFSPLELEKRLPGRPRTIVDGAAADRRLRSRRRISGDRRTRRRPAADGLLRPPHAAARRLPHGDGPVAAAG
ncbi:MAG: hypothetical protein ACK53L_04350, partial [Pirellulaceae bacterium]